MIQAATGAVTEVEVEDACLDGSWQKRENSSLNISYLL
jgi:hypothetical protein